MARSVIKLPSSSIYGQDGANFTSVFPSLSQDNEYIPVRTLMDGELITFKKSGRKNFLYKLCIPNDISVTGRVSRFCFNLFETGWFRIQNMNITQPYYSTCGMVFHIKEDDYTVTPLMALSVKSSQLFNVDRKNPDPNQFCLVIDNSFITNDEHFKVFRNVNKQYIEVAGSQIDVLYTNNLMGLCFNSPKLSLPKFATFAETVNHMKDVNTLITA